MCAKKANKNTIKKTTSRTPAPPPSKNTARKSAGRANSRAHRTDDSDYSDEDIEHAEASESASSDDEIEEDFLHLRKWPIWRFSYSGSYVFPHFHQFHYLFVLLSVR